MCRGFAPGLAEEHHEDLPENVERGQKGRRAQESVDHGLQVLGLQQDFVLGPETRQRRNTRQG